LRACLVRGKPFLFAVGGDLSHFCGSISISVSIFLGFEVLFLLMSYGFFEPQDFQKLHQL